MHSSWRWSGLTWNVAEGTQTLARSCHLRLSIPVFSGTICLRGHCEDKYYPLTPTRNMPLFQDFLFCFPESPLSAACQHFPVGSQLFCRMQAAMLFMTSPAFYFVAGSKLTLDYDGTFSGGTFPSPHSGRTPRYIHEAWTPLVTAGFIGVRVEGYGQTPGKARTVQSCTSPCPLCPRLLLRTGEVWPPHNTGPTLRQSWAFAARLEDGVRGATWWSWRHTRGKELGAEVQGSLVATRK